MQSLGLLVLCLSFLVSLWLCSASAGDSFCTNTLLSFSKTKHDWKTVLGQYDYVLKGTVTGLEGSAIDPLLTDSVYYIDTSCS